LDNKVIAVMIVS